MRAIAYLTTHDLVWINNVVTGKVNPYNYVTLEAAMAGQYNYGQSLDVPGQAAKLLERLLFTRPFTAGNRRTAYIATQTFLEANGCAVQVSDAEAAQIIQAVETRELAPQAAIARLAAPTDQTLPAHVTLRQLITHECNLHVEALKLLTAGDE